MPHVGTTELILVLLIILIIFGAGKLHQVGESLGKAIRGFRKAQSETDDAETETTKSEASGSDQK